MRLLQPFTDHIIRVGVIELQVVLLLGEKSIDDGPLHLTDLVGDSREGACQGVDLNLEVLAVLVGVDVVVAEDAEVGFLRTLVRGEEDVAGGCTWRFGIALTFFEMSTRPATSRSSIDSSSFSYIHFGSRLILSA